MRNDEAILVKGAKVHNLKNVSVTIPHEKLTVITGLSGSGKSSLAFDTIFAEGQRRYVESLSPYARQFIQAQPKPDVENIEGLAPTIAIQQKTTSHNPRSTVGTVTEIFDYMRLLFARVSKPFCTNCNLPISSQSIDQMIEQVLQLNAPKKLAIVSPMVRGRKGEYQKELSILRQKGFNRVRIDGELIDLTNDISLNKSRKHDIDVYIDKIILRASNPPEFRTRLSDSITTALKLSDDLVVIEELDNDGVTVTNRTTFSQRFACVDCGISYPEPEPRTFSFNSPMGACAECDGLGYFEHTIDSKAAIDTHSDDATDAEKKSYFVECKFCNGTRLKSESLSFKISNHNIAELAHFNIDQLLDFFKSLHLSQRETLIAERIVHEIIERLQFLKNVGVAYLQLDRSAQTLSGGESQRIRLASQLGSKLVGVIYILDEPSIGLHQRDNDRLIETLKNLRDQGNTILVVEHDKDTIAAADYILDLGPGAGSLGGEIIAQGSLKEILSHKTSTTAAYMTGRRSIPVPKSRRPIIPDRQITIKNLTINNINDLDVSFPLGTFTCVTGVSGSGKSTLVIDALHSILAKELYRSTAPQPNYSKLEGLALIDKVVEIDQSPIGRTPRSNPATYTGTFSFIRELFAQLPQSRVRGFKPGRFSFNVKGGRCESCGGDGLIKMDMHFLTASYVTCDFCSGRRYNIETLDILYKDKSISDVLNLTIDDATIFFENVPSLHNKLKTLQEVGLGYVTLGQSATTLSGGEAQRMKIAKELSKRATGKTLYILDEPSTGLHFEDVAKLIQVLHRLVDQGNSVLVIEHNLEIIKTADHVIDLGPDAGASGGRIIAQGTPEVVANSMQSITGQYLKPYL